MSYIWLLVVAGGAGLLGFALAFGMMKEDSRRTAFALLGAAFFAVVAIGVSSFVTSLATAPIQAADGAHSEEKLPAGPAHTEELPGK